MKTTISCFQFDELPVDRKQLSPQGGCDQIHYFVFRSAVQQTKGTTNKEVMTDGWLPGLATSWIDTFVVQSKRSGKEILQVSFLAQVFLGLSYETEDKEQASIRVCSFQTNIVVYHQHQ